MSMPEPSYQLFVGVDVAAATFMTTWQNSHQPFPPPRRFDQTLVGMADFLAQLAATEVLPDQTLVVMEATGSYWITLATQLHTAGYVVSVVNAAHAHHFARSQGQRAKTDAVDARMLGRLARERRPAAWTPPPDVYHELRQRLMAREALVAMRTQARKQQHALHQWPVTSESVHAHVDTVIATLSAQIDQLEDELAQVLAQSEWAESAILVQTIPGISVLTTAWLLMTTSNFTVSRTPQALAAYAGLVPMAYASGTSVRGRPCIGHAGNKHLRHALYMATVSASQHNPIIRPFYQRLRGHGKHNKVARCAAARKLLQLAWAVVEKRQPFDPAYQA